MKNILLSLLAILVVACSDEAPVPDVSGVYSGANADLRVTMRLDGGHCASFGVSINGADVGTWKEISTTGSYPDYTYKVDGLRVRAHFIEEGSIAATLDGVLRTGQSIGPELDEVSTVFDEVAVRLKR